MGVAKANIVKSGIVVDEGFSKLLTVDADARSRCKMAYRCELDYIITDL